MPRRADFVGKVALRVLGPSSLVAGVAGLAMGFLPLFAGPGYESALGAGLVLPWLVAASTASRARHLEGLEARVWMGAGRGLLLALVVYVTTLVHGARAGFCGFTGGTALFALGPALGAVSAGVFAAFASTAAFRVSRRPFVAVTASMLGPLGGVLFSLARFYASPVLFSFDPFFGFFSGVLYDTVVEGVGLLLTYRAGTLATLAAAVLVARRVDGDRRPAVAAAALACAVASAAAIERAPSLGHAGTPTSIARALGGEAKGELCRVIHARTLRPADVALFVRDCDADVRSVAAWLGVEPVPVTAYLFAGADEKRRLMGAADVYVAKPWRREVYLQAAGYPHPVLRHEIAHAVAASVARGPFGVAGTLGGLWPNPGLIEGLAVAASPEDDELSPAEWSAAMLELRLLPPMRDLFSLGFLRHDASRAYTAAGAFVEHVRARHGAKALATWYATGDVHAATGRSLDDLERDFHARLREIQLPPEAKEIARARFDRPAIFARRCPHEVDTLRKDATRRQGAGDHPGARDEVDEALGLAPRDGGLLLLRATCSERLGDATDADARLRALAGEKAFSLTVRLRARERLADRALAEGRVDEARIVYEEIRAQDLDENRRRTLDVKLAAVAEPDLRPGVVALLIGPPDRGPDTAFAMEALGRVADRRPVAAYLLARSAAGRGDHAYAAKLLDEVLAGPRPAPTILRETARLRIVSACAMRDAEGLAKGVAAMQGTEGALGNRRELALAFARSCL